MHIRVAQQQDLGTREPDGGNAPYQSTLWTEHGAVGGHAIPRAEVNFNGAPPVRGLAQDDLGQLQGVALVLLPSQELAQMGILPLGALGERGLEPKLLVFAAEGFVLPEDLTSGQQGISRLAGQMLEDWANPTRGRNRLPMPSLSRAVVWLGRFRMTKVNSTTRPTAM